MTWLVVMIWAWSAIPINYPTSVSYSVDPDTGGFTDPTHYRSLAELPFPVGWPLHYVMPSNPLFLPATLVGAPLPPTPPARVLPFAMLANFVLIVLAIASLVYLLQKFMLRFSLLTMFLLMSAFPLYLTLGRLVAMVIGPNSGYGIVVYFSPIAVALAARYSLYPRIRWSTIWRIILKRHKGSLEDYDNPDDAIAAAARLDMLGDWNASIDLYRHVSERWPEHNDWLRNCIERVQEKQSLSQE